MKKLIGALLLAGPLSAVAATEHPDGSVTLTAEESRVTLENLNTLMAEREKMALIIMQLMERIESSGSSGTDGTHGQGPGGQASGLQCT